MTYDASDPTPDGRRGDGTCDTGYSSKSDRDCSRGNSLRADTLSKTPYEDCATPLTRHVMDLLENWRSCLLTLSVGFAGAPIFAWTAAPPWVTGPLFFSVILALRGSLCGAGLAPSLHGCPLYPVRHGGSPDLVNLILSWWPSTFSSSSCCGLGDASDGLFNLSGEVRL